MVSFFRGKLCLGSFKTAKLGILFFEQRKAVALHITVYGGIDLICNADVVLFNLSQHLSTIFFYHSCDECSTLLHIPTTHCIQLGTPLSFLCLISSSVIAGKPPVFFWKV